MNNPTSAQWANVLKNLEKVLPLAKRDEQLNMIEHLIRGHDHACGTVHCFGGWYGVPDAIGNPASTITYRRGADKIANDLGFTYDHQLENWAEKQRNIWGNKKGTLIFGGKEAFTPGDKTRASNLKDIYDHIAEVHDRTYLLEQIGELN